MNDPAPAPLRFAVLRHDGVEPPHFDFLFETAPGSQLQTWRLMQWPVTDAQEAVRIRDHRSAFLTYQGDLTSDRGRVMRIDEGTCAAESSARQLTVLISPSNQRLLFQQDAGADTWHVRALDPR